MKGDTRSLYNGSHDAVEHVFRQLLAEYREDSIARL